MRDAMQMRGFIDESVWRTVVFPAARVVRVNRSIEIVVDPVIAFVDTSKFLWVTELSALIPEWRELTVRILSVDESVLIVVLTIVAA